MNKKYAYFLNYALVFKTDELSESMDFKSLNELNLRKCIMDLNICIDGCENYDLEKYNKLLILYDEFVSAKIFFFF